VEATRKGRQGGRLEGKITLARRIKDHKDSSWLEDLELKSGKNERKGGGPGRAIENDRDEENQILKNLHPLDLGENQKI